MDTKPSTELSLEDSIKLIVPKLPKPIQDFFVQDKVSAVTQDLMQKYRLHADQANVLQREIIMLLLGIRDPEEFGKNFGQEAGLDQATVSSLISAVNEQVFTPLDDAMRGQAQSTPVVRPATIAQPRTTISTAPRPRPVYPPPANLPGAPTPKPEQLLEDREEPHIELRPAAPRPTPQPIPLTPKPAPPQSPILPRPIPAPVPPPAPATPIVKQYSADPYREPIDDAV